MKAERTALRKLVRAAKGLDFYEIVRLLERVLAGDRDPQGRDRDEAELDPRIVFEHLPDLSFPVRDVASITLDEDRVHVVTTFLGLLGTVSPLTPDWSEGVLLNDEEGALRAFYDVFHHRAVSMLFLAHKTHALEGGFDLEGNDVLSQELRSVAGSDAWAPPVEDDPLPGMSALGLADYQRGHPQTIDLDSAERLLQKLFPTLSVRVQSGVPRFVRFDANERTRLGLSRTRLGEDLVYGDGMNDREGVVRVRVGPVGADVYHALMPGGVEYARVEQMVERIFAGAVDVELEVHVASKDAPRAVLGRPAGTRLGVDARYSIDDDRLLYVRVPLLCDASRAHRTFVYPLEGPLEGES